MEKREYFRKYLINILKNCNVYYITKDKIEREVYSLDYIEKGINQEGEMINKLFAIKNDEIRINGKVSENIESLLLTCLNDMSYLGNQKRKGNYLDIKDDDTLEIIADKLKRICVDEEINIKNHKLSEEEEKILEESSVRELKKARNNGIESERKYIKEIYKENLKKNKQKLEEEKQELRDMGLIYDANELSKKTYALRYAREKGLKKEIEFLKQN